MRLAELHCHLDGVLDTALAAALGLDVELPAVRSLADWELYSARVAQLADRDRWLPRVLERHVARLREQRVRYAELFVSGILFARDDAAALVDYVALLDAIATRGIHLELCPSSNLALGVVSDLDAHPIERAQAMGLPFSINTDDPGAFGCSLAGEVAAVAAAFELSTGELDAIFENTMRAAFRGR